MDDGKKVVHYYHANADAFGGRLEQPFEQVLPILAPSSLPVVGGYGSARHENFRVGELISIDRAYTQVAGNINYPNGNFLTLVTAVIEGLNVDNILFADRIAVQISTDHPPIGYFPRVSFIGTEFRGLRIGGCELEPVLKLDLCHDGDPRQYPDRSCLYNENLIQFAQRQSEGIAGIAGDQATHGGPFFERLLGQHSNGGPNASNIIKERGNIICSIVEAIEVKGKCPGAIIAGHVIEIPGFGRIYLGELIVDQGSFDLTMLRLDLGCPTSGKVAGPHGGANGSNSGGN